MDDLLVAALLLAFLGWLGLMATRSGKWTRARRAVDRGDRACAERVLHDRLPGEPEDDLVFVWGCTGPPSRWVKPMVVAVSPEALSVLVIGLVHRSRLRVERSQSDGLVPGSRLNGNFVVDRPGRRLSLMISRRARLTQRRLTESGWLVQPSTAKP
jgi:hypothetical protein